MRIRRYRDFRSTLSAVSVAVAAAVLTLSPAPAASQTALGLPGPPAGNNGADLAGPSGSLPPATRRTKPYRAYRFGECENNICTFVFSSVRANKLLEISNVSCTLLMPETDVNQFAVLSSQLGPAGLSQVATLPGVQTIPAGTSVVVVINGTGPYFFRGGDDVQILSGGTQGNCTLSGYISRTD